MECKRLHLFCLYWFIYFVNRRDKKRKYFCFLFCIFILTVYEVQRHQHASQNISVNTRSTNLYETATRNRNKTRIKLLYWSTVFGKSVKVNDMSKLPYFHVNKECSSMCELTVNRSEIMHVDALIIHVRDVSPFPPQRFEHIPFILHTNENPAYTDLLKNPLFLSHFNYLLSYRLDADFLMSLFRKPDERKPLPFHEKTGLVFAAFSNCEIVRTTYLAQLMKFIPVHSYGACLQNSYNLSRRYTKRFKERKKELQRYYKFTLVFMNADCEYFVDDQLTHALSAGSVPVFMGTDKINMFLPGNLNTSIINVRDFDSPKDVANYLKYLSENETKYNEYLRWKHEGFIFPHKYNSTSILRQWQSPNTVYCRICKKLLDSRLNGRPLSRLQSDLCNRRTKSDWL